MCMLHLKYVRTYVVNSWTLLYLAVYRMRVQWCMGSMRGVGKMKWKSGIRRWSLHAQWRGEATEVDIHMTSQLPQPSIRAPFLSIMPSLLYTQHPTLSSNTQHPARTLSSNTQHPVVSKHHTACNTQHPVVTTQHPAPNSQQTSHSTQHPTLSSHHPHTAYNTQQPVATSITQYNVYTATIPPVPYM